MLTTHILFIVMLVAIVAAVVWTLLKIVSGADKRLLLAEARGTLSDAPDVRGISVLCSGADGPGQVRNLLDVGYPHYEAVLVLDSVRCPQMFAEVQGQYRLIQVNYNPSGELPVNGVRGLYRSRKRCFRRLVLIDKAFTSQKDDFDAATGIAIYDYVLPLTAGVRLMPFCIGRLAAELSLEPVRAIGLMKSNVGVPLLLANRDAVVAAGGFGPRLMRDVPRNRQRTLYEPLLRNAGAVRRNRRRLHVLWIVLLVAAVAGTVSAGWWEVCAVLLTGAVVAAAAEYALSYAPAERTARAASRKWM